MRARVSLQYASRHGKHKNCLVAYILVIKSSPHDACSSMVEHLTVDQMEIPPLDRSVGCLPSLIISNNSSKHSSQNDADVVQMGG